MLIVNAKHRCYNSTLTEVDVTLLLANNILPEDIIYFMTPAPSFSLLSETFLSIL